MTNEEYLKKFNRCIYEYVDMSSSNINEDDPNAAMAAAPADPNAMAAAPAADPMMADPMAMGAAPAADPNAMAMGAAPAADPNAMAAAPAVDPNAMGAAPATDTTQAPGFTPNQTQNSNNDDLDDDVDEVGDNVEDVKKSNEETYEKLDKMSTKFEEMLSKINSFEEKLNDQFAKLESFEKEMTKRNPTPEERLTLRSRNSYPYEQTVDEYWDEKENDPLSTYSSKDDMNGEDMEEYQIRQSDIDNMRDWRNISKSYDDERNSLRNLLGY